MTESSVRQRLEEDLKSAMRAGDTVSRDAIRYILSAVKNAEIDARGSGAEQAHAIAEAQNHFAADRIRGDREER